MNHHADNAVSSHEKKLNNKMTAEDIETYKDTVDGTSDRLRELCERWAAEIQRNEQTIGEEVVQKAHSAIGKSQLLRNSKFKQFRGFLRDAEQKTIGKPVLLDDIRGFWETIYIQVEEVNRAFDELDRIKANNYATPAAEETVVDGGGGSSGKSVSCAPRKAAKKSAATAATACARKPVVSASSSLRNFISAQRERKKPDEVGGNGVHIMEKAVASNGHA